MRRPWSLLRLMVVLFCMASLAGTAYASRSVVDETGRRMEVPDRPHRIICLAPNVTDTVFALGAGADVVAISDSTKYPAEALAKPSVGSALQPSVETILSLHPDLVVAIRTAGSAEAVKQLTRLGVPVFLLDPQSLDGLFRSVESCGLALHREGEAAALVQRLRQRVAAVRERVKREPAPRVFMPIWYDPILTIGRHAFMTELIEAAGARSVTDDLAPAWPQVSLEEVLLRAPQGLLLLRNGTITLDVLRQRPGWNRLAAVREGRAFYVDDRLELASPVAISAMEDLARQMHP